MELDFGFEPKQLYEEGRVTEEDVRKLKEWVKTEDDIPDLSDAQLCLFSMSCNNKFDATKKCINAYYKARYDGPELFNDRDMDREDVQQQLKCVEFSIFPRRTPDDYAILFHRLYDTYYLNYDMEVAMKVLFMTLDTAVIGKPPKGLIVLFDMKGVGLLHLTRVRLGAVRKFCFYLQEGLPVQLRAVHVLNAVPFMDKVMAILKPFLKRDLYNMLYFHPSSMDMQEFYEKYVPNTCLPEELGGELPSVRTLHEENTQKLRGLKKHFENEEIQRVLLTLDTHI